MAAASARIEKVAARAFRIPTDAPESDGTLEWDATTLVLTEISAGGEKGVGYTYASAAAAKVITETLVDVLNGQEAFGIPRLWNAMVARVRNLGSRGICACAISAIDVALWDLKAKVIGLPVVQLLGAQRDEVAIYGSGGFTSYTDKRLKDQLASWARRDGCRAVKMKVGRDPARDPERVAAARSAIGDAERYVDANGALSRKQALAFARSARSLPLPGLRSLSQAMISKACGLSATALRPAWTSPRANMAMSLSISAAYSRREPLMCSRQTPPAAAALRGF